MIVKNDTARAVNPTALAIASGATKPRFSQLAQITPNIPRWNWSLTDQLKAGCECQQVQAPMLGQYTTRGQSLVLGPGKSLGQGRYSTRGKNLVLGPGRNMGLGFFDIGTSYDPTGADSTGTFSLLGAIEMGANFIPGVGQVASSALAIGTQAIQEFESWFNIGAGRIEADAIVPTQNRLMSQLGAITDGFKTTASPSLEQMQTFYREVWQLAVLFMEFVLQAQFTDRRASGQALNTVMPYIDGSCGYAEPLGSTAYPTRTGCIQWGQNQIGGVGSNGMLGTLERGIQQMGGQIPTMPATITDAANSGFRVTVTPPPGGNGGGGTTLMGLSGPMVLVGIAALFLYSRRSRG